MSISDQNAMHNKFKVRQGILDLGTQVFGQLGKHFDDLGHIILLSHLHQVFREGRLLLLKASIILGHLRHRTSLHLRTLSQLIQHSLSLIINLINTFRLMTLNEVMRLNLLLGDDRHLVGLLLLVEDLLSVNIV